MLADKHLFAFSARDFFRGAAICTGAGIRTEYAARGIAKFRANKHATMLAIELPRFPPSAVYGGFLASVSGLPTPIRAIFGRREATMELVPTYSANMQSVLVPIIVTHHALLGTMLASIRLGGEVSAAKNAGNYSGNFLHMRIMQDFSKIRSDSSGWGYRVAAGGALRGATRRSAKSLDMPANRTSTGSLPSARYHNRTRQLAATPRYARKYLILREVPALVACPGVSHQVVAPVPPVP